MGGAHVRLLFTLHDHRGLGFDGSIGDLTALIDVVVTVDIRWCGDVAAIRVARWCVHYVTVRM